MKSLSLILSTLLFAALVSCDSGQQQTERTVLDADTVAVEKEYEVEKQVREVTVDTVTEEETVTRETELDSADNN